MDEILEPQETWVENDVLMHNKSKPGPSTQMTGNPAEPSTEMSDKSPDSKIYKNKSFNIGEDLSAKTIFRHEITQQNETLGGKMPTYLKYQNYTPPRTSAMKGLRVYSGSASCALSHFTEDMTELLAMGEKDKEQLAKSEQRKHNFRSGATYDGLWLGHMRHGYGVQRWMSGALYEGEWQKSHASGKGRFTHESGDTYIGEWKMSQPSGLGVSMRGNGAFYSGQLVEDLQEGVGIEVSEDGACYEGSFWRGKKHGVGKYTWPDGSIYYGAWNLNRIEGPGVYTGVDGKCFRGQWQASVMHGAGKYSWPDGRVYQGQYKNNHRNGFGILRQQDQRYEGYWADGYQHGLGRLVQADNSVHYAVWNRGCLTKWVDAPGVEEH